MKYITRNLENVVNQVTKEYPVVLVTGPRQVGKTTMLQKLMEGTGRGYVTLDDLNDRNIAKTDPELFLQLHKPPVLIDEVQYCYNSCMLQPIPTFGAEHNYFSSEKAKCGLRKDDICIPGKVILADGTDATELVHDAEKFLNDNSFFQYDV